MHLWWFRKETQGSFDCVRGGSPFILHTRQNQGNRQQAWTGREEQGMEYRSFGKAGVKVSRIALGLGLRGQADEKEAQRLVEHAIDGGINFVDCANLYGPLDDRENKGQSEIIVGKALASRRDRIVLTSKVFAPVGDDPNDTGLSAFHILREIDNSLRRLNTDHLDFYLVHNYDDTTPQEETLRALDDIVRSGKARYIGCCNHQAWQVCRALWISDSLGSVPYVGIQNQYNLLTRGLETEMFGLIRNQALGAMAYSPLAVGLLSGAYRPGERPPAGTFWGNRSKDYEQQTAGGVSSTMNTLFEVAEELNKTPAQIAIAWILSHNEITTAISGADNTDQIDDVIGSVGWTLPEELRSKLDANS